MDQLGLSERWHMCFQPRMNTWQGDFMHTSAHTDQAKLHHSHHGSTWSRCGHELEFGSGWSRAPVPFPLAKTKHSACLLDASLYPDSPPTRELFAADTGILGALDELCCLLPPLPPHCWSCHTASCCMLLGCFHSSGAAWVLHVKHARQDKEYGRSLADSLGNRLGLRGHGDSDGGDIFQAGLTLDQRTRLLPQPWRHLQLHSHPGCTPSGPSVSYGRATMQVPTRPFI